MVDLNKGATVELVKVLSDDIRTDANGVKHSSAGAAVRDLYNKLENEIDALAEITHINSWADVQKAVRSGMANKVFAIGDQLTCQRDGVNLVWDVIGIDHDTPADPQFTHSMTLQLHDCFPTNMQFDAREAFYYCETALEAGTYHFTVGSTDYQFTLESDIAAGSQLILNFTAGAPSTITVSATKGGAVSEGSVTVTAGSDGSELMGVNDINRARYDSNNYKESAIRQWLNSSAAAGSVWTPQTDFDRPPSWAASTAGFLNGMDADFLAAIGKTHIVVVRNTVTDGGGSDEMDDKFFLLSRREVFGGNEIANVIEGEPYPYYANYSDLSAAAISADSNRIKYRAGTAQYWWLRSPYVGKSEGTLSVYPAGAVYDVYASSSYGVAPACCII